MALIGQLLGGGGGGHCTILNLPTLLYTSDPIPTSLFSPRVRLHSHPRASPKVTTLLSGKHTLGILNA